MSTEIILLRGLFRGSYHWGAFPKQLQAHFHGYNIECLDIPGNGFLAHQRSPASISDMVESLRKQRKGEGKVHILAVSMGGMIALKWAERYPNEIESVICINTSAKEFSPFYERLLPQNYLRIIKALFSTALKRETIIYNMVSNKPLNNKVVNHWANTSKDYPMSSANFWRQLIAASRFSISKPSCDLHFVATINDRLVNFKATKAIADAWNIPVVINNTDGHDVALDNPEWLLSYVSSVWKTRSELET